MILTCIYSSLPNKILQCLSTSCCCRLVVKSCLILLQSHGLYPGRLLCPWDFPGKNTCSGLPFPSPGDLPDPGITPASPALAGGFFTTEPPGKPFPHLHGKTYAPSFSLQVTFSVIVLFKNIFSEPSIFYSPPLHSTCLSSMSPSAIKDQEWWLRLGQ